MDNQVIKQEDVVKTNADINLDSSMLKEEPLPVPPQYREKQQYTHATNVIEQSLGPQPTYAQTGTEGLVSVAIEIGFALLAAILTGLYFKFRNHPIMVKLGIKQETIENAINKVAEVGKVQATNAAIKTVRENNIHLPGVDKLDPNLIKEYGDKAKDNINTIKENMGNKTDTTSTTTESDVATNSTTPTTNTEVKEEVVEQPTTDTNNTTKENK